jgi:hypothetical protein
VGFIQQWIVDTQTGGFCRGADYLVIVQWMSRNLVVAVELNQSWTCQHRELLLRHRRPASRPAFRTGFTIISPGFARQTEPKAVSAQQQFEVMAKPKSRQSHKRSVAAVEITECPAESISALLTLDLQMPTRNQRIVRNQDVSLGAANQRLIRPKPNHFA